MLSLHYTLWVDHHHKLWVEPHHMLWGQIREEVRRDFEAKFEAQQYERAEAMKKQQDRLLEQVRPPNLTRRQDSHFLGQGQWGTCPALLLN